MMMQAQRPLSFKRPTSLWAQKQSGSRQEEGQLIKETNSERTALFHSRLLQEAEKIRKWKNATELEIQQKNHQIQTSQSLIERQQKSLIDVQLQNESLNTRIEEEMANQKELQRKVYSTREMCHALKEHVCKVESSVELGENDRKEMKEYNSLMDQQYMELLEQFQSLEKEQSLVYESLKDKVETEKAKREQLTLQLSELSTASEEQIKVLQGDVSIATSQCTELKGVCEEQSNKLTYLKAEKDELEKILNDREACLSEKIIELKGKEEQLVEKQLEILELNKSLDSLQEDYSNLKSLYDKGQQYIVELTNTQVTKEKEFSELKENLESQLREYNERIAALENQLMVTEEQKSSLLEEQNSLLNKLDSTRDECSTLQQNLTEMTTSCEKLQQSYTSLENKLTSCQNELSSVQSTLEAKENEIEAMRQSFDETLKGKDQEIGTLMETLANTQTVLSTVQNEQANSLLVIKDKDQLLQERAKEVESLHDTMSSREKENLSQLKMTSEELAQIKCIEQEITKKNEDLQKEMSQIVSEHNQKIEELKLEIESKDKSISDYNLKVSELSCQTKMEKSFFEKQTQSLCKEKEDLEERVKQLTKELNCCQSKEEEATKRMDALAEEMALTLEKYQAENLVIVEQKDKDIEQLREAKMNEVREKEELKKKVIELEQECTLLHQEKKDDSAEDIEQYRLEIQKLKTQLQVKDDEVAQLIMAAGTLKAQVKSPKAPPLQLVPSPKPSTPFRVGPPLKPPSRVTPKPSTSSSIFQTTPKTPQTGSIKETLALLHEKRRLNEIQPELTPENDTAFKKPKTKVSKAPSSLQQSRRQTNRSGRENARTPFASKKGNKKSVKTSSERKENLSWFDSDPIFGFPLDD